MTRPSLISPPPSRGGRRPDSPSVAAAASREWTKANHPPHCCKAIPTPPECAKEASGRVKKVHPMDWMKKMRYVIVFLECVFLVMAGVGLSSAEQTAEAPTSTSINLTWTAPGDDRRTGRASTYDIRYSLSPITAANWGIATQVTGEIVPKTAGSAETFSVTGLNSSTSYYFAIKTADEVPNWSKLSNVVKRTTTSAIQCCSGRAGNVDCDLADRVDIADLSTLINYLYFSSPPLCCAGEANLDGSPGGEVDIADLTALMDALYLSLSSPAPCR